MRRLKWNQARHRIHIPPRQFLIPLLIGGIFLSLITGLFFWKGWHVPDNLQPLLTLAIYCGCTFLVMYVSFWKLGIYVEN